MSTVAEEAILQEPSGLAASEHIEQMGAVAPFLLELDGRNDIVEGRLPANHAYFPEAGFDIKPYKMSTYDQVAGAGVWAVQVYGQDMLMKARVCRHAQQFGNEYTFLRKAEPGELQRNDGYRAASSAEVDQIMSVVSLLPTAPEQAASWRDTPSTQRRGNFLLRLFGWRK